MQRELNKPGVSDDKERMKELLMEMDRLSRALRDPSLAEDGLENRPETRKLRETKQHFEPSKYLAELEIAAGDGDFRGASDRPGSTYVLNSISLC